MGLDMYLNAKKLVFASAPDDEGEKSVFANVTSAAGLDKVSDPTTPHLHVSVVCVYWRKANNIHRWFVENVQEGVDDCNEYDVERDQLKELSDLCKKAISEKNPSLLPPSSGFFFGSTDIGEWYWDSLQATHERIDRVLQDADDETDFTYQSSW